MKAMATFYYTEEMGRYSNDTFPSARSDKQNQQMLQDSQRKSDVLIIQAESIHHLSRTINETHCLCLKKIRVLVFSATSYMDTISDPILSMNPSLPTEVKNTKNLSPKEREQV